MGYKLYDRVKETTATTGTGTVTLAGAATGFKTFQSVMAAGDIVAYCIELNGEWEVGEGTLVTTTTLSRDAVLASSNADALVNFSAGTKNVFITAPAHAIVDQGTSYAIAVGIVTN